MGREAHPADREGSGGTLGGLGSLSRLGDHSGGPGVVGRFTQCAGSGQESLAEYREGSGALPSGPVGVWSPSRWARSGWETLIEGREWFGDPLGGPRVVRKPT